MSKFIAVFLPLSLLIYLLTQKDHRRWLAHPAPYLVLPIVVGVMLPLLVWNYRQDWPSVFFFFNYLEKPTPIRPYLSLLYPLGQAVMLLPWIWIPLAWELVKGLANGPKQSKPWFLCLMVGLPLVFFILVEAFIRAPYMYHRSGPFYLFLFPLVGRTLGELAKTRWVAFRRLLGAVATLSVMAGIGFLLWVASDRMQPVFNRLMISPSSMASNLHLTGFRGLDDALRRLDLPCDNEMFLFSNHYMDSSLVAWATRGRMPVKCFSQRPIAFAFVPHPRGRIGANGLCITRGKYANRVPAQFSPYFKRYLALEPVTIKHRGHETVLHLNLFYDMVRLYPLPYGLKPDS